MPNRSACLLVALVLGACGGDDGGGSGPSPSTLDTPGGPARGAQIAAQSGCLACHRLGAEGHDGPGVDLTRIGATLSRAQIERSLLEPPDRMPSYEQLARNDRETLVEYLSGLR